jgi:hypothetical protein
LANQIVNVAERFAAAQFLRLHDDEVGWNIAIGFYHFGGGGES